VGSELAERVNGVRNTIALAAERAGRDPNEITLVAVSKTFGSAQVVEAAGLGLRHFGENRVQEAADKIPAVASELAARAAPLPTWHLIGHLQSNKARLAVSLFSVVESVDSLALATTLNRLARPRPQPLDVLVEVNVGREASKSGFLPEELSTVFPRLWELPWLRLRGLMTVAPLVAEAEDARPFFRELRRLRDELLAQEPARELPELSMGMTGDYPVAIEEGATIVRVGRAIFGERPLPAI
jgi:pyridoxal phosphate enzyme (YggS family)